MYYIIFNIVYYQNIHIAYTFYKFTIYNIFPYVDMNYLIWYCLT